MLSLLVIVLFQATPASAQTADETRKQQIGQAHKLAHEKNYREAVDALEKLHAESPDTFGSLNALYTAAYYAALDDKKGHAKFSHWALDHFVDTKSPWDAEHPAKGYATYSGANDPELLQKSVTLSQKAIDIGFKGGESLLYLTHAMVQTRLKHYDQAEIWLQATYDNSKDPIIHLHVHAYTALNQIAQGNNQAAKEALLKAKETHPKVPESRWQDRLIAELAIQEAQDLLKK